MSKLTEALDAIEKLDVTEDTAQSACNGGLSAVHALSILKFAIEVDEATVVKNFPNAAKGYFRCKMLIDEMVIELNR